MRSRSRKAVTRSYASRMTISRSSLSGNSRKSATATGPKCSGEKEPRHPTSDDGDVLPEFAERGKQLEQDGEGCIYGSGCVVGFRA